MEEENKNKSVTSYKEKKKVTKKKEKERETLSCLLLKDIIGAYEYEDAMFVEHNKAHFLNDGLNFELISSERCHFSLSQTPTLYDHLKPNSSLPLKNYHVDFDDFRAASVEVFSFN